MEVNKEEALKAKEVAEKRFGKRDFNGAKNYALKAKTLFPEMDGISQMVATFDVYVASEIRCNGEVDYYSILGLKPSANKEAIKKQYKKMAVLLHPDKNKTVGADGAFKLVSEAWALLSDNSKRNAYDIKRTSQLGSGVNHQPNLSSPHASAATSFNNYANMSMSHGRLDTFWTVCTSCKVQYEYLRKYVNKKLRCKNCRGVFIAVETGAAPVNGSFPYCSWSNVAGNRYGSHGFEGVTYIPGDTSFYTGHGYEYVSNVSFQWNSSSGVYTQTLGPNGPSSVPIDNVGQTNGHFSMSAVKDKARVNGKRATKNKLANMNASTPSSCIEVLGCDFNAADKRRKVVADASLRNGYVEKGPLPASDSGLANGNATVKHEPVVSSPTELSAKRNPVPPAFDARKLLIEKARTVIRKKLEEMRISSANAAAHEKSKTGPQVSMVGKTGRAPKTTNSDVSGRWLEKDRAGPISINVPDSDFHDFDKDRSEECFKAKQIWALYDEEDGMPRLYCLIREIISVKPFKILISYLNSKTDTEFGSVNWLEYGFTKSCGNFRAWNSDVVEHINIFSHLLSREKAGRGGCIRIYPRSGDIWAVYRNWSSNWDRSTPDEVRHRYEMVEVLDDYSEELGCCICPLVKLTGFKTVYQRNADKDAIRWIPRKEMVRFSHQVPSYLLKGEANNLPEHCWDLDPAATPDELLHTLVLLLRKVNPLTGQMNSAGQIFRFFHKIPRRSKPKSKEQDEPTLLAQSCCDFWRCSSRIGHVRRSWFQTQKSSL